jgi:hypothetical protein
MAARDRARFLQRFPIVVGVLGGSLLLLNRLYTPVLSPSQARGDVVGVLLSAFLILTGLLWQQFQPQPPEAVVLVGEEGFDLAPDLPELLQAELAWASQLILAQTVTASLMVYYQNRVILRRGILGPSPFTTPGPIVQRVLSHQKPIYLVDLKLYPGRIEFDYLPENTQGLICHPLGEQGVLILGANVPRSYTQQDEAWIGGIAEKLTFTLQMLLSEALS